MAAAKKLEVVLDLKDPKKHSVKFETATPNAPAQNVYLTNAAVAQLGDPASVKVTIEAI